MVHLAQKYRVKVPCGYQYSLDTFQRNCPTLHLQPGANPEPLQITTAFMHREPPVVDEEHKTCMEKLAMNHIKRFSHIEAKRNQAKYRSTVMELSGFRGNPAFVSKEISPSD
jgi:hypothetical protein